MQGMAALRKHGQTILAIRFRLSCAMNDLVVRRITCARVPTPQGEFRLCIYANNRDGKENLALILGDVADQEEVLVRLHSECFTGDVLGSLRCDCGDQLRRAMAMIAAEGSGVLLYLRQEGRGIGLADKLRAYNLQDQGYDTVDANLLLGHQPDERDYSLAALMLQDLGVRSVRLLTNNPTKIAGLQAAGMLVRNRVPLEPNVTADNIFYLLTKVERMGHIVHVDGAPGTGGDDGNGPC